MCGYRFADIHHCVPGVGEECLLKKSGDYRQTQMALARAIGDTDDVGRNTGSRYRDGNVPNGNSNSGKLYVNWYNRDNTNDNLRPREVVVQKPRKTGLLISYALYNESSH